jgi:hypothetical protein
MPVAPQIENVPIDVGDTGFEQEEGGIVYEADSDDLDLVYDAAAAAQAAADLAAADADAALLTAQNAVTTANGKNKVTFSTVSPSGTGTAVGDIWFQRNGATGVITGSWEWDGSSWTAKSFGDQVLNSLTAGKITAGTIDLGIGISVRTASGGARVNLDASGLRLYDSSGSPKVVLDSTTGNAIFTGEIQSASGNIGGLTLSANTLTSSAGGLSQISVASGDPFITTVRDVNMVGYTTLKDMDAIGTMRNSGHGTVSGVSANVQMGTNGVISRVVSSRRYKSDIVHENPVPAAAIMQLQTATYISKNEAAAHPEGEAPRYLGLIAEEVAAIPELAKYLVVFDDEGKPESLHYAALGVVLLPLVQEQQRRIDALEARLAALEANS